MKTDELIAALATNVEPVDPRRFSRVLARLMAGGVAVAAGLMLQKMGLNPDLPAYLGRGMFWVKLGFGIAVAALAVRGVAKMARPGQPVGLSRVRRVRDASRTAPAAVAAVAAAT